MPEYVNSISEMVTMPVGLMTEEFIDVWCNTATNTPHKIRVGDMIAVKWNADIHNHEYTWCTVLDTQSAGTGCALTLMHEQAVDVPDHPADEATHVTYNWMVYASGYQSKWMVYNFDQAGEHGERVVQFANQVYVNQLTFDDCWDEHGVDNYYRIANLSGVPGDWVEGVHGNQIFIVDTEEHENHWYTVEEFAGINKWCYLYE